MAAPRCDLSSPPPLAASAAAKAHVDSAGSTEFPNAASADCAPHEGALASDRLPLSDEKRLALISKRKQLLSDLAIDIFSRGNVFMKNVYALEALPEGTFSMPEVAFIGTPGSGKSSLIANLSRNKHLGRKSMKVGSTKGLAFFNVGDAIALVDTPGYGAWNTDTVRRNATRRSEQAVGIGVLLQYLALRKQKNLRHVYWCFRGQKEGRGMLLTPRHEELLKFLLYERIPFTPIITSADFYDGRPHALAEDSRRLAELLGNPNMSILYTSTKYHKGKLVSTGGTEELMCDIVSRVCHGFPNKCLTYKHVHSMSYLPYAAEEQQRVERAYPRERIFLPINNMHTMASMVGAHDAARLAYAENLRHVQGASMAAIEAAMRMPMHNYRNNLSLAEQEEQILQLLTGEVALPSQLHEGTATEGPLLVSSANPLQRAALLEADEEGAESALVAIGGDGEASQRGEGSQSDGGLLIASGEESAAARSGEELTRDGGSPALRHTLLSPLEGGAVQDENAMLLDALSDRDLALSGALGNFAGKEVSSLFDGDAPSVLPPRTTVLTPFQADIVASGVSPAFPCLIVPPSMFSASFDSQIARLDSRSMQAYEQRLRGTTLEEEYSRVDTFLTAGAVEGDEEPHSELRAPRRITKREARHHKYMVGNPRREAIVTEEKAMCPWLGAEKEGRVLGLDSGAVVAKGGTMVPNLKDRGFGGKSHTVFTYKSKYYLAEQFGRGRWSK